MTTIRTGRPREVELLKMPNRNIEGDAPQSVRDHLVFIGVASYVGGGGGNKRWARLEFGVGVGVLYRVRQGDRR